MLKRKMIWLIISVLAFVLLTLGVALFPKGDARVGLLNGHLALCPDTPNCVCSEDSKPGAAIAALTVNKRAETAWQDVKAAIVTAGGDIQSDDGDYLWASFTSRWLRFVDDVELRMDVTNGVIHIRSASRVSRSDLGVNRARMEKIRELFINRQMQ